MFGRDNLNKAKKELAAAQDKHGLAHKAAMLACEKLFKYRSDDGHKLVARVEAYVNTMKKTPANFDKVFEEYKINYTLFDGVLQQISNELKKDDLKTGAGVGVGVAAGAATAFMGPTAAMAVATTFGTASTGAAISGLGGAAATNAALAWLGGGAIASGGGGMLAGNALLAMAGPIGWTLAGVTVVGGVAYSSISNFKNTDKVIEVTKAVYAETLSIRASTSGAEALADLTKTTIDGLQALLIDLRDNLKVKTVEGQSTEVLDKFAAMVNHVRTLGKLLTEKVLAQPESDVTAIKAKRKGFFF